MEKRLMLAMLLSMLVVLLWSASIPKPATAPSQAASTSTVVLPEQKPVLPTLLQAEEESPTIKWDTKDFSAAFIESSAAVKEVSFNNYHNDRLVLGAGFAIAPFSSGFKKQNSTENSISFSYQDADKEIVKVFNLRKSNYSIDLHVKVKNTSAGKLKIELPLLLGLTDSRQGLVRDSQNGHYPAQEMTVASKDKIIHWRANKDKLFENVKFLGLSSRYFCAIANPSDQEAITGYVKKVNNQVSEFGINPAVLSLDPGQEKEFLYHIYMGPRDLQFINAVDQGWSAVVYFGTFDIISQILLQVLNFFHNFVHNWGLAIILLSIFVYIVLYPLTLKQMRSMKEMQVLQPKVEALRKQYKDNPQKMNKEVMELYREHKVNPLGGCLPLLLQMPIFFALYQALLNSISLKGARFLWIQDLSTPDRLYVLKHTGGSFDINLLPILMTIGMFIQQKISSPQMGGGQNQQQKMMLILMPLLFGFIFYTMPSGLVLYWFVNSTLMLVYQWHIYKAK